MKRAFTVIELLVVFAIIVILAALLFPVINKAEGTARKTRCIYNVAQINHALLIYADDHADAILGLTNGDSIYFTYKDSLGPYLSRAGANTNDVLFACPADDFNCDDTNIKAFFIFDPISGTGFHRQTVTDHSSYVFNARPTPAMTRARPVPFPKCAGHRK
jgi:prepilin-type N-terminal cleavage/methylation domain-containing protein